MPGELRIIPIRGIGEVRPGDDLAAIVQAALKHQDLMLADGDVLVVTQKIVSKAEGRIIHPEEVEPSATFGKAADFRTVSL
jgi:coenzyme F420-0:L-glutamate ligase/coenzyme F420-1:gamma-L-glutamate ligase